MSGQLYFSIPVQSIEDEDVIITSEQVTTACKNTFAEEIESCTKRVTNLLFSVPLKSVEDKEFTLEQVSTACKNTFAEETDIFCY